MKKAISANLWKERIHFEFTTAVAIVIDFVTPLEMWRFDVENQTHKSRKCCNSIRCFSSNAIENLTLRPAWIENYVRSTTFIRFDTNRNGSAENNSLIWRFQIRMLINVKFMWQNCNQLKASNLVNKPRWFDLTAIYFGESVKFELRSPLWIICNVNVNVNVSTWKCEYEHLCKSNTIAKFLDWTSHTDARTQRQFGIVKFTFIK